MTGVECLNTEDTQHMGMVMSEAQDRPQDESVCGRYGYPELQSSSLAVCRGNIPLKGPKICKDTFTHLPNGSCKGNSPAMLARAHKVRQTLPFTNQMAGCQNLLLRCSKFRVLPRMST